MCHHRLRGTAPSLAVSLKDFFLMRHYLIRGLASTRKEQINKSSFSTESRGSDDLCKEKQSSHQGKRKIEMMLNLKKQRVELGAPPTPGENPHWFKV